MFDRETRSLWTQVDGSALRGEMKGARLTPLPAVHTTWGQWKKLHPDSLVLKKNPRINGTTYANYHANPYRLGVAGSPNPDPRLPGKALVVGLREGSDALAVSLEVLKRSPVYQTKFAGRPVLVVFYPASSTARVFSRQVGQQMLNFELVPSSEETLLRDRETSTLWSGLTGKAIEGKLGSRELTPVRHMISYWFAWVGYNPHTRLER